MPTHGTSSIRFRVGDKVRVRRGIMDVEYPDIPLGGWAGTIVEVNGELCVVEWSKDTLTAVHPVYKNRCERDGSHCEIYHLPSDELEPDSGGPLDIEQPTKIIARPLSPKDPEDRIRMVFGLTSDDLLPKADDDSLRTYHRYLSQHLKFPLTVHVASGRQVERIEVIDLNPPDEEPVIDAEYGLVCTCQSEGRALKVPLSELEEVKGKPNRQLVEDYSFWFHNWC